jgi:outer membrane protein OmpA-like peptidoglycan-associated protein
VKNSKHLVPVLSWVLLCSPSAIAQELPKLQLDSDLNQSTNQNRSPWTLFGGISTAFSTVSGKEFPESPTGTQWMFSALLSYQAQRWVLDGGVGWWYNQIKGMNAENLPIDIRTRSGAFELSPRYRLSQRWQIGPVINLNFGSDSALGSSVGQSLLTCYLGGKVVYEIPYEKFPVRFLSQVSTDLSVSSRQAWFASAGIQIGIPFHSGSHSVSAAPVVAQHKDTIQISTATPAKENILRVNLDNQNVFFGTNSTRLQPKVKKILSQVGTYLEQNQSDWDLIEVNGHADQRGSFKYNLNLSKRRAQSVKAALLASGTESDKVKSQALSFSKPMDQQQNKTAWAKNRRVELIFHQVKNPELIVEQLKPLMTEAPVYQ